MRVEFELDGADFAAFARSVWQRRVGRRLSARRWALLGALLAVAVVLGGLLTWLDGGAFLQEPLVVALIWAIGVVLGLLLVVTLLLSLLQRFVVGRPPRDASMLGWRAIELTSEGVVETTASGTELTRWDAIREVAESPEQIHLYLNHSAAHVVPKRVFASAADAARFVERARGYIGRELPRERSASGWSKPAG